MSGKIDELIKQHHAFYEVLPYYGLNGGRVHGEPTGEILGVGIRANRCPICAPYRTRQMALYHNCEGVDPARLAGVCAN